MYAANMNHTYEYGKGYTHTDIRNRMRAEDRRSEDRIARNRIRRQQELKNNFLALIITICLITACSFTVSAFRSNAKTEPPVSYKYYKSIAVSNKDTLWSLAEQYMDEDHYDSITDYIDEVRNINSLAGDVIHYGEYLIIPYYDSNFIE